MKYGERYLFEFFGLEGLAAHLQRVDDPASADASACARLIWRLC
jgi:hypothetical protein